MRQRFITTLFAIALLCSCAESQKPKPKAKSYKMMAVELSDREISTQYPAQLTGHQYVDIRPQVAGVITRIAISEASKVRRGQLLFVIDQAPYRAALTTAKANLQSAQSKLQSAKLTVDSKSALFEDQIVSEYDLQMAKNSYTEAQANVAQAEAAVVNAETNLAYTEVRSPVNGVAGMIPYRVGALVNSSISQPLVSVADDSEIYAYFSISQNQLLDMVAEYGSIDSIITNMPQVKLTLSNGREYNELGQIDAISGTVDSSTGAIAMRATFDNPDGYLRNGANATLTIPTTKSGSIVIPKGATYELQNKVFVFRVLDGKARSTEVEVYKLNSGTEYIVESGLSVGDEIIAEGAGLIKDGSPVAQSPKTEKE